MNALKKTSLIIATAVMSFGAPSTYVAASEITPISDKQEIETDVLWSHIARITSDLSINNSGRATITGSVVGNMGATNIVVDVGLYRVNPNGTHTHVHTFSNLRANGQVWAWSGERVVARGHDYVAVVYATVHRNGATESDSTSSEIVRAN